MGSLKRVATMGGIFLIIYILLAVSDATPEEKDVKGLKLPGTSNLKLLSTKFGEAQNNGHLKSMRGRYNGEKRYKINRKSKSLRPKENINLKRPHKKKNVRNKNKQKLIQQKKNKKKKRNKNKKKKIKQSSSSCSASQANRTCMEAALTGMLFEANQISNFLKQAKLLQNHYRVSGNKAGKKDDFKPAKDHLLWAIGGNISDPQCGPKDVSASKYNSSLYKYEKNLAIESLTLLENCSRTIHEFCNISNLEGYAHNDFSDKITLCNDMMRDAIDNNKRCQSLTEDVKAQCNCWINQTIVIGRIKEQKCQAKSNQKKVTDFKKKCTEIFKECKKMEDKSVESIYYCMDDHSMKFINQTKESLANAAEKDAKSGRFFQDEFSLQDLLVEIDKIV